LLRGRVPLEEGAGFDVAEELVEAGGAVLFEDLQGGGAVAEGGVLEEGSDALAAVLVGVVGDALELCAGVVAVIGLDREFVEERLDAAVVLVGEGSGGPHVPDSSAWFLECAHELSGALSGAERWTMVGASMSAVR